MESIESNQEAEQQQQQQQDDTTNGISLSITPPILSESSLANKRRRLAALGNPDLVKEKHINIPSKTGSFGPTVELLITKIGNVYVGEKSTSYHFKATIIGFPPSAALSPETPTILALPTKLGAEEKLLLRQYPDDQKPIRGPLLYNLGDSVSFSTFQVNTGGVELVTGSQINLLCSHYSVVITKKDDTKNVKADDGSGEDVEEVRRKKGDPYLQVQGIVCIKTPQLDYEGKASLLSTCKLSSIYDLPGGTGEEIPYPEEAFTGDSQCPIDPFKCSNPILLSHYSNRPFVWVEILNKLHYYNNAEEGAPKDILCTAGPPKVYSAVPRGEDLFFELKQPAGAAKFFIPCIRMVTSGKQWIVNTDDVSLGHRGLLRIPCFGGDKPEKGKKGVQKPTKFDGEVHKLGFISNDIWKGIGSQLIRCLRALIAVEVDPRMSKEAQDRDIPEDHLINPDADYDFVLHGSPYLFIHYLDTFSWAGLEVGKEVIQKVLIGLVQNKRFKSPGNKSVLKSEFGGDNRYSLRHNKHKNSPVVCLNEYNGDLEGDFEEGKYRFFCVPSTEMLYKGFDDEGELLREQNFYAMNSDPQAKVKNQTKILEEWCVVEVYYNSLVFFAVLV